MTMKIAALLLLMLGFAFVQATVILDDEGRNEQEDFNEDDVEAAGEKWEDAPEFKELADPEMSKMSESEPRIQKRGLCYKTRRHVCFGKPRRCGIFNLVCCHGFFRQCAKVCVVRHGKRVCHIICRYFYLNHCFVVRGRGK